MSDVVARIAEALEQHAWFKNEGMASSEPYHQCKCGAAGNGSSSDKDWADHVAGVVAEALQLTEEWAVEYREEPTAYSRPRAKPPSPEMLERTKTYFPGRSWVSRYVTPWVTPEGQE